MTDFLALKIRPNGECEMRNGKRYPFATLYSEAFDRINAALDEADRQQRACAAFDRWLTDGLQSMAKTGRMEVLAECKAKFRALRSEAS